MSMLAIRLLFLLGVIGLAGWKITKSRVILVLAFVPLTIAMVQVLVLYLMSIH